jgi:hypothetical protein
MEFLKKITDNLPWGDLIKGLVAVAFPISASSGAAYAVTFFPSLNPKVINDIWFFNVLAMVVASCLTYFLSLSKSGPPHRLPGYLAGTVFAICQSSFSGG